MKGQYVVRDKWGYSIDFSETEFSIEELKAFSGLSEEAEERFISVFQKWETEEETEYLDQMAVEKNSR